MPSHRSQQHSRQRGDWFTADVVDVCTEKCGVFLLRIGWPTSRVATDLMKYGPAGSIFLSTELTDKQKIRARDSLPVHPVLFEVHTELR